MSIKDTVLFLFNFFYFFRCKKWVEKCQRQELLEKPAEHLYRNYRLCGKHFDKSAFDDVSFNLHGAFFDELVFEFNEKERFDKIVLMVHICLLWLQDIPGTVLKVDAVPTIFDFPPQPQTEQVKRGKQTVSTTNR